jgi:hypothetical protein
VESIKGLSCDDITYGIATVQPNRAIKRCRIRNLRIEYYLISEVAVVLVIPKSCSLCEKGDECTDDFIMQIIEKISEPKNNPDPNFPF